MRTDLGEKSFVAAQHTLILLDCGKTRAGLRCAARPRYFPAVYASRRYRMGLDGVGLSVDDDVFKLEIGNAGGVELVVLDSDVEIFQEDVADVGLAGVGLNGAEGGVRALDAN